MKPQCNTSADCLRELARVMDQFNFVDHFAAISSKYVKENGRQWDYCLFPEFTLPNTWQFAIAEVEGKPVFVGDELWCYGEKFTVEGTDARGPINLFGYTEKSKRSCPTEQCSWNPPKPATVMVEMTVTDAETYARNRWIDSTHQRTSDSCKKALEKLK